MRSRWLLVGGALLLAGVAMAMLSQWLCDDAFISFRYARNLVAGHGLVYNAEERVEGFSNFLWTLQCAAAIAVGVDAVTFAQAAGVLCFLLTGIVLLRLSSRLLPGVGTLPIAAAVVLLHTHSQEFASCGLETAQFTLLVTLLASCLLRPAAEVQWWWAGLLAGLLALSRPDGAIFGAVAGVRALLAATAARRPLPFLAYALPSLALLVPFLLWRHAYYSDWLPNTFYAKSGNDPYVGQGIYYCVLYFTTYFALAPALGFALVRLFPWRGGDAASAVLAWMTVSYLAFVVWVGGDFMFARFLLPITPLLALLLELLLRSVLPARLHVIALAVAASAVLFAPQPTALRARTRDDLHGFKIGEYDRGIGDERAQYPKDRVAWLRGAGYRLGKALSGVPTRVVFFGTQAMLVYEADFSYALEGTAGLTDRHLAHQVLAARGRPGHEKGIYSDPGYALTQRVHFLLEPFAGLIDIDPWRKLTFFGVPATIVRWDEAVMGKLRGVDGVEFTDFVRLLDDYLAAIEKKDKAQVAADYAHFKVFYFDWNEDPMRRGKFEAAMK